MKKHSKHTKLTRPEGGNFHRVEFGFIGAPCSVIQKLTSEVADLLKKDWSLGYVDAEHGAGKALGHSFQNMLIDKISFKRFDTTVDVFGNARSLFNDCDAVLVNGNHYKTARQILILNEKKKESLSRKLDRINRVDMILLDEGGEEIFDFLEEHLKGQISKIPILKITDTEGVARLLSELITDSIPNMIGVVFAGGKSTRMGKDKGEIKYHQLNQREHLAELLKPFCEEIYLSGRREQVFDSKYELLEDTFVGLGPYGGLLSTFQKFPNQAIFTLPVDVPFVDEELLQQLFENRNPRKLATCFHNPETKFPEPLITIWEPRAYPILLDYLSRGYSCPRKVLINTEIEELELKHPEKLFNANTPEERDYAAERVKK